MLGEVYNDSDVPLEQVRVGVDLVDDQDNPIAQANSLLSLDLIDIGERAPFAVLFGTAPDSFDRSSDLCDERSAGLCRQLLSGSGNT